MVDDGTMRARLGIGALIGLLAAGAAIGVGELVAGFLRPAASPIIVVGNRFITLTPESVKRWAIREFGTNDKHVLLSGIYVVIALFAIGVGLLAVHRLWLGLCGLAVFGVIGVYCAVSANGAQTSDVVPALFSAGVGLLVLRALVRVAGGPSAVGVRDGLLANRRRFLQASAATAGLAAAGTVVGRYESTHRFDAAKVRAAVRLPIPASPAPALPAGVDLGKGAVPFLTPNAQFYRIDTALTLPQIDPAKWKLRIHGLVEHEIELSYAQLLARPMIQRYITLNCVSNEVGGDLISTAEFLGAPLADLLREAGVDPSADQLVATSYDGMTIGSPTAVVLDGRDAMLAVGMNGEPLPIAHGFPVRMVVPGLYGYVSACKWIVDIEATTFAATQPYWVEEGWVAEPRLQLAARIDTPKSFAQVKVGQTVPIAGVAWDQHVGVSKVEVQVDGGEWTAARLAAVPSTDTWRQWVLPWTVPSSGEHTLRVRATDAKGQLQPTAVADPFPSGATGLHQIKVRANQG